VSVGGVLVSSLHVAMLVVGSVVFVAAWLFVGFVAAWMPDNQQYGWQAYAGVTAIAAVVGGLAALVVAACWMIIRFIASGG
jgi:hypothetical protein